MIKIFVYQLDEKNADILLDKMSLLSLKEKEKVLKYKYDKDRALSLAGRLMFFCFANRYKNDCYKDINYVSADDLKDNLSDASKNFNKVSLEDFREEYVSDIEISYTDNGKGYIEGDDNIYYSISHSKDTCVCAIADVPVGIDIQEKRKVRENVAKRFFHDKDNEYIYEAKDDENEYIDRFIKVWTVKESYIKLTGRGIAGGMNYFYVDFQNNNILDESEQYTTIHGEIIKSPKTLQTEGSKHFLIEFKEISIAKYFYCYVSYKV